MPLFYWIKLIKFLKRFITKKQKIELQPQQISEKDLLEKEKFYQNKFDEIVNEIENFEKVDLIESSNKKLLTNCDGISYSIDNLGAVIFKDGCIFRGIYSDKIEFFKKLYKTGILQVLGKHGILPKFAISDYYTEEFPLILNVEKVFMLSRYYYCFNQKKDMAILTIFLKQILNHFNYDLIDGHCYNLTINNGKPVFIDFGSIIYKNIHKSRLMLSELVNKQLLHLLSMQYKNNNSLLDETSSMCLSKQAELLLADAKKYHKKHSSKLYNKIFNEVFYKHIVKPEYVDLLFTLPKVQTAWGSYVPGLTKFDFKTPESRFKRILELIETYSPDAKTATDLAGNSGYLMHYLEQSSHNYEKLINIDYDTNVINEAYEYTKNQNSKIENLLIDFFHCGYPEIVKADVVFALALTHHLILTQGMKINHIFSKLYSVTKDYVYVEFCPLGMYSCYENIKPKVPDYYTKKWFEKNFKMYFDLIKKETLGYVEIKNVKYPHRVLFVGKKKKGIRK